MGQEIERKFLVKGDFKNEVVKATQIKQGYLSTVPERTVRVRVMGAKGFITVKGISNATGSTRYEWEKEITVEEVDELLKICEPGVISKTRFEVSVGKHIFEVDEFDGENEGLVVAELELTSEEEEFEKPNWLGIEVTGDSRYFNSELMKKPYSQW